MSAWEEVYSDLVKNDMFCGLHDWKHGKRAYMHGIYAVMDYIAFMANKEDEFDDLFFKNMKESEKRAKG